jgi:hypothetical protein
MPFGLIGSTGPAAADYTAARAALIDRLALLQAGGAGELTIARAALLSNLDGLLSNRLGKINSIQEGTISIPPSTASATATITAVVVARSVLLHLGMTIDNSAINAPVRLALTNSTTITAQLGALVTSTETVRFMVIEFAA